MTLYRRVGDTATALDSTDADNQGKYAIDWDLNTAGGYYTRVERVDEGGKTCLGDRSKIWIDVS